MTDGVMDSMTGCLRGLDMVLDTSRDMSMKRRWGIGMGMMRLGGIGAMMICMEGMVRMTIMGSMGICTEDTMEGTAGLGDMEATEGMGITRLCCCLIVIGPVTWEICRLITCWTCV